MTPSAAESVAPTEAQLHEIALHILDIGIDGLTIAFKDHTRPRLSYTEAVRFSAIIIERWQNMLSAAATGKEQP